MDVFFMLLLIISFLCHPSSLLGNGESTTLAARTHRKHDLIHSLPGQPKQRPGFKQYGGYVTVDVSRGRSLYYYFAEAATKPDSKPLILWLNGGPGCSSLLGAMVEIGPFGVNPDGKSLYPRRFAWNKVANTLFLESPAGVGFSYSNTSSDYRKSGDKRTAEDAYAFLLSWFERFPHYKTRDFYIAGESYAGHYIPELVDVILQKNMESDLTFKIQVKGIMIGNGLLNDETDTRGISDFLWSHALISDEAYHGYAQYDIGKLDPSMVGMNWRNGPSSMFPIYRGLMSSGLRILLYSGDVDSIIPVTSTRYSIAAMGLKVKKPWIPWYAGDSNEVAGYRVIYDGLSFATVRGAGHLVPQSKPSRAFALLNKFIVADDI
ncbi:hypothetical protein DH2020_029436 [Rehmannia glutinosa]|uniref:Carboxypeptidase n=1 Tax=Rehmannia glutinosa TaxID=99300 RepID=A0ABR0VRM9_REHGL